jgi:hypothetical protein
MWTDDYVLPAECNAFPGRVPANGSVLYSRSFDDVFAQSIGAAKNECSRFCCSSGTFLRRT